MTIDDPIRDEKLKYGINREATKTSALSSGKINKYEYLTGEKILPSNQKQIIEQVKFTYSPLGKAFEKQTEVVENQGEKQVKAIQNQGQIKASESNKGVDNESNKIFGEFSDKQMNEIKGLSRQIDFNNSTYQFKSKSISPINFIGFKAPLHLYRDIFDGNIILAKAEENQKQFKSDLNEMTRGNTQKKSVDQIKTIENIKNLYKSRQKVVDLFNDFARIRSESIYETKYGKVLKILT